jgi:hypothetical protein
MENMSVAQTLLWNGENRGQTVWFFMFPVLIKGAVSGDVTLKV